jgi:hypothetical protein
MTNYITAQQFTDMTGITSSEVEATGSETVFRDSRITQAQSEFERDIQKTFTGAETDYALAQRAIAFLAAHLFRISRIELEPSTDANVQSVSPYLTEYRRLKSLVMNSKSEDTKPIFGGGFSTLATVDLENKYRREGFVENR